jgi:hypothetical protein
VNGEVLKRTPTHIAILTFKEFTMQKRFADLFFRREVAGVILFWVIPKVFLNDLGRSAFRGYYVGVIATWIAYVIALRRQEPSAAAR